VSGSNYAWSWDDYQREKAKAERAAAKTETKASPVGSTTADDTGGREGQAAERRKPNVTSGAAGVRGTNPANASQPCASPVPAEPPKGPETPHTGKIVLAGVRSEIERKGKLALAGVPSAMECEAARWAAKVPVLDQLDRPIRPAPAGSVLCKCGSQGSNLPGPVPAWFGCDCIEANCPLRGAA